MFWFVLIGIGMATGDVLMKHWIVAGAQYRGVYLILFLTALFVYSASLTLFAYQLRVTPLSIATILPILINIVVIFFVGILFLDEKLNYYQLTGVCLSLIALFFLSRT